MRTPENAVNGVRRLNTDPYSLNGLNSEMNGRHQLLARLDVHVLGRRMTNQQATMYTKELARVSRYLKIIIDITYISFFFSENSMLILNNVICTNTLLDQLRRKKKVVGVGIEGSIDGYLNVINIVLDYSIN